MKLAEALIERADAQKRIEQLRIRLNQNAKVQEGDEPAEDPQALLEEIDRISARLATLIQHINRTNSTTLLPDSEMTIADAIAVRDILKLRHTAYKAAANAALITQDRYSKSEVRFRSTLDVGALQKSADELARQYRELDTRLQAANWQTDLM
jgi:hypothetical protein